MDDIPSPETDAICAVFDGRALSIEQIRVRLPEKPARRTLQRRLAKLVERGRLLALGERRGRRYRVPGYAQPVDDSRIRETPDEIPLSAAAREIRGRVLRPLTAREPVGYRQEFLGDYRPNISAYLSAAEVVRLAKIGRVAEDSQPAGTHFRKVLHRLLIDLSWNSSRLEGNTYSLLETERLLERGENAEGKDARDAQMILNHKAAIELLAEQPTEIGFNRYTICNLHALLSDNLLPDPGAGGRLRDHPVGITGTVYHPESVPQVVEEHFQMFLAKAEAISNPFEQAFFAMVHLPYLQPFEDVNKRTSRLAANIPLVRRNLCPLSFVDVPQPDYIQATLGVYELNRTAYLRDVFLWAYERSCARYSAIRQEIGDPDVFRMKYRAQIADSVRAVVGGAMDKAAASRWIAAHARESIPGGDVVRFVETTETELTSLHEGNMARYRIRPSEYRAWRTTWT